MPNRILEEIIAQVFQAKAELNLPSGRNKTGERYYAVFAKNEPKWIIPANPIHGLPFLKQWHPYNYGSRAKWWTLILAYRSGQLGKVPGVTSFEIEQNGSRSWENLGWTAPDQPCPTIYVGVPGPSRKAVIGLFDIKKGRLASIAKFPLAQGAKDTILHEAEVLKHFESLMPGLAPRSIFVNPGLGVAAQEVVTGRSSSRKLTKGHGAYLLRLVQPKTVTFREMAGKLMSTIDGIPDIDFKARQTLEGILSNNDFSDTASFPFMWIHGDFAPWNLVQTPDGDLLAIDWEYASKDGLPLFDLIYFRVIQSCLFNERVVFSRSDIGVFMHYMTSLGIPEMLLPQLAFLCFVECWLHFYKQKKPEMEKFILKLIDSIAISRSPLMGAGHPVKI